jgi:hypothetical protein
LRKHAQCSRLGVRDDGDRAKDTDHNVSRDEIVDRLAGASIGNMIELDRGELGEPLPDEMLLGARARSRIAQA